MLALLATAGASSAGCSVYDVLFGALGEYHSGGGEDMQSRHWDYRERVESWERYEKYGG